MTGDPILAWRFGLLLRWAAFAVMAVLVLSGLAAAAGLPGAAVVWVMSAKIFIAVAVTFLAALFLLLFADMLGLLGSND